jgi:hypothetical protein
MSEPGPLGNRSLFGDPENEAVRKAWVEFAKKNPQAEVPLKKKVDVFGTEQFETMVVKRVPHGSKVQYLAFSPQGIPLADLWCSGIARKIAVLSQTDVEPCAEGSGVASGIIKLIAKDMREVGGVGIAPDWASITAQGAALWDTLLPAGIDYAAWKANPSLAGTTCYSHIDSSV